MPDHPTVPLPGGACDAHLPGGACDAHLHLYDSRLPHTGTLPAGASADDYRRAVQQRLGLQRAVVVTPRPCGTDNRMTLQAIARLGLADTRGVGVLHPGVPATELQALHAGGIRGLRFTLYTAQHAATGFEMVEPVARMVAPLGWHLQLHWTPGQIVEHQALLRRLPTPLVFDHRARLAGGEAGLAHPAFAVVADLVQAGRAWVKLSGPYLDADAPWTACDAVARRWVQLAPERLVWGSDWPHLRVQPVPDAAELLAACRRWTGSAALLRRILHDNPAALYG